MIAVRLSRGSSYNNQILYLLLAGRKAEAFAVIDNLENYDHVLYGTHRDVIVDPDSICIIENARVQYQYRFCDPFDDMVDLIEEVLKS